MATQRRNLPRHGSRELLRKAVGPSQWRRPNQQAVTLSEHCSPAKAMSGRYCWESRMLGQIHQWVEYPRNPYVLGERQCRQGSNGNKHLSGTRGKGGGMLRQ